MARLTGVARRTGDAVRHEPRVWFAAALLVLSLIGLASYLLVGRLVESSSRVTEAFLTRQAIDDLVSLMKDAETAQRGYVITGAEEYLEPNRATHARVAEMMARLAMLSRNDAERTRQIDTLRALVAHKLAVVDRIIQLRRDRGFDSAAALVRTDEGKRVMDQLRTVASEMAREEQGLLAAWMTRQEAGRRRATTIAISGALLALALTVGAWTLDRREIRARRQRSEARQLLQSLTAAVGAAGDTAAAQCAMLERVCRAAGWGCGQAWTTTPDGAALRPEPLGYGSKVAAGSAEAHRLEEAARRALQDGAPAWAGLGDGAGDGAAGGYALAVPVLADDAVVAVLGFHVPRRTAAASRHAELVESAARQLGPLLQRRQAEDALRSTKEQLSALVEHAPLAIIAADRAGNVTMWNPAAERMFGWAAAEAYGGPVRGIPPYWGPALQDLRESHLGASGEAVETYGMRKDGAVLDVSLSLAVLRDAAGEADGVMAVVADISDRKRAEQQLRAAKEAAEQARARADDANRAKSDFLATMSHELRTPLNSVIGFANVMLKNRAGRLGEPELTYLARIADNGRHLLSLVNDVLDLSKIEAGKMPVELAPVALGDVVRAAVAQMGGAVKDRAVVLAAEVPDGLAPVESDAGKLQQILLNLVGNALKFTDRGAVTVRVVADAAGRPTRVDVADTGIGIPPERQAAIFEAFEQAEAGTSRRFGGTGLGLAISRSLAELLGYRLVLESVEGKGSTFSVVLDGDGGRG